VAQALSEIAPLGDYLGGSFVLASEDARDGVIERRSPRDFSDTVIRVPTRASSVDEAIARARAAFPGWSRSTLEARKELLMKLRQLLGQHADELALAITREVGKPRWEAQSEVQAALAKIDITLADGLSLVQPREMAAGQRYEFRPHGVAVVLGPFNFPLHLVHGHVVPLLVMGNTVVIKPSELTPLVGQLYARCCHEAGFPAGVVNLVQGGAGQGARLAAHPDVDAVMLTGSAHAGQAI
jgi:succinylglutamic semialdehyde dehydrogenase